jgi:outer membrane protein
MGIGISIPLFQSGGAVSGIGEAVESQKATAEGVEAFERTFLQRAHTSQMNLNAAKLRVIANRKGVVAAKENLEIVNKRAEIGMATTLDVLDAQIAYLQSESDLIGSVGDFRSALAEWDYVTTKSKD